MEITTENVVPRVIAELESGLSLLEDRKTVATRLKGETFQKIAQIGYPGWWNIWAILSRMLLSSTLYEQEAEIQRLESEIEAYKSAIVGLGNSVYGPALRLLNEIIANLDLGSLYAQLGEYYNGWSRSNELQRMQDKLVELSQ